MTHRRRCLTCRRDCKTGTGTLVVLMAVLGTVTVSASVGTKQPSNSPVSMPSDGAEINVIPPTSDAESLNGNELNAPILGGTLRFDEERGVLVAHVTRGGPLYRAGIRTDDALKSIEQHKVASLADVAKILEYYQPNHGLVMTVDPKPGPRQVFVNRDAQTVSGLPSGEAMLGISPYDASDTVVVGELSAGGPAADAGLRTGDEIKEFDGYPIESKSQLIRIVKNHRAGDRVDLLIERAGWQRETLVTLGSKDEVAALPRVIIPSLAAGAFTSGDVGADESDETSVPPQPYSD